MQHAVGIVAHGQRQTVWQVPALLREDHTVYHQRSIAAVVYRQRRRSRLGNRRVAEVHAAVATQVGTVDAHRAGVYSRQHIAARAVAQGGVQKPQRVAAIAMQAQQEACHHTVGTVQRRTGQAGEQQRQRVAL